MVAIKNRDADSFVARPSPAQPIVLLYGPDAGLVRERAEKIIGSSVDDVNDPFALVRLDGDELAAEPSRLTGMAAAAKKAGAIDASDRLADLVLRVAGITK